MPGNSPISPTAQKFLEDFNSLLTPQELTQIQALLNLGLTPELIREEYPKVLYWIEDLTQLQLLKGWGYSDVDIVEILKEVDALEGLTDVERLKKLEEFEESDWLVPLVDILRTGAVTKHNLSALFDFHQDGDACRWVLMKLKQGSTLNALTDNWPTKEAMSEELRALDHAEPLEPALTDSAIQMSEDAPSDKDETKETMVEPSSPRRKNRPS